MPIIGFLILIGFAVLLTVLQQKGKLRYWAAVALWCLWGVALIFVLIVMLNWLGVWDVGFYPHERVIVR